MSPRSVQGFNVVPLYFSSNSSSHHELFVKEHNIRTYDENKPSGRTLFVINVPPYADEASLKRAFAVGGEIESIILQNSVGDSENVKSKHGFKVAFVVFEKREGLLKTLKLENLNPLSSNNNFVSVGLNKWIHEYNESIYNHDTLSKEVNKFIEESDRQKEIKESEKEVDDEGWTVVTKKGRNPGVSRKESVENKIIQKNKLKSRKKELKNFYTFQLKEQKMNNIIALRKSFQESKEKVNLMKKMRKFKPF